MNSAHLASLQFLEFGVVTISKVPPARYIERFQVHVALSVAEPRKQLREENKETKNHEDIKSILLSLLTVLGFVERLLSLFINGSETKIRAKSV